MTTTGAGGEGRMVGPVDLLLAFAVSAAALVAQLALAPGWLAAPLTLLSVFVVPGFALLEVFTPGRGRLPALDQAVLVPVLSTSVSGVCAALLALFGRLELTPLASCLAGVSWVLLAAAYLRRAAAPTGARYRPDRRTGIVWVGALGAAAVLAALAWAGTVAFEHHESYSAMYLLGPSGALGGYPTDVAVGARLDLGVGVQNREGRASRYQLRVLVDGRQVASQRSPEVAAGADYRFPVSLVAGAAGAHAVRFELYRDGSAVAVRSLTMGYRAGSGGTEPAGGGSGAAGEAPASAGGP